MHAWKRSALARLDTLTDETSVHPRDQATDIAAMLKDIAELRTRAERALGQAFDALDVKVGHPVADEDAPHTSTRAARLELGLSRDDVHRFVWLGRLEEQAFARVLRRVRKAAPGRHLSARALHKRET